MAYELYPAVDEQYSFPPEVRQALAVSLELRNDVEPMTTAIRNNLLVGELWDGRTIANTTTDRLERYDAGTLTWKSVTEASDLVPLQQSLSVPTGFRNVVRNGDMQIAQRGNGPFTDFVSGKTGVDGWVLDGNGGTQTETRVVQSPGLGSAQLVHAVSGHSALDHYARYVTRMEDVNTLSGKVVTVSFNARAESGAPKVLIELEQKFGVGGSATTGTTSSQVTLSTTMQRYSVTMTVPSVVGKTLGSGANFLQASLWLSGGSAFSSRFPPGIQNNTFYMTDFQVEEGPVATPFERLPIQEQLALCQRYLYRLFGDSGIRLAMGWAPSTTDSRFLIPLPVPMRTYPSCVSTAPGTFSVWDAAADIVPSAIASWAPGAEKHEIRVTLSTPTSTKSPLFLIGITNAFVDFSAEL